MRQKDKTEQELENDKKWDKVIQIGVLIMLVISIWQFRNSAYKKGYENGCLSTPETMIAFGDCLYSESREKVSEISVLTEKKKCEEMGGEFDIQRGGHTVGTYPYLTYETTGYELLCTSPAKELFKYNIK